MSIFSRFLPLLFFLLLACAEDQEDIKVPNPQNEFTYFSLADGLVNKQVTALFEDNTGNIWIGTADGISVYDGNSFENYTAADGLIEGSIVSIGQDSQGDIWVGGFDGYAVFDGQSWESSYGISVSALYLDEDKTFWIGTYGLGLIEWRQDGQLTTYSSDQCAGCNYFTKVFEDNEGEIWCSTFGGAMRFDDGSFTLFGASQGVNDFLSAGTSDDWGNTWFGSLEGHNFDKIDKGKVSDVNFPTGFTSVSGMVTNNNTVYVATNGSGLLYYDGVVVREIVTPDKDYNLLSILADSRGDIWIGTDGNGLILLKLKDNI